MFKVPIHLIMQSRRLLLQGFIYFILVSLSHIASATTVSHIDFDQVIDTAELVFEGEVISANATWDSDGKSIFTEITFRVDDVIKGYHPKENLTLRFAGGVVNDTGMRVSSMVYPDIGERGIYFVENKNRVQINPLVGWGQGHFLIEVDDANNERILTENRDAVISLESTATNTSLSGKTAVKPSLSIPEFSEGVARGVNTGRKIKSNTPNDKVLLRDAIGKPEFKALIKARLTK